MSNNIILELRQGDSARVRANGDFETQLAKDITIEEGDVVQLKSCFIDTKRTTNNEIILEKDITLKLQNGIYINDWLKDTTNKINYINQNGSPAQPQTGNMFIPYKLNVVQNSLEYEAVKGYKYNVVWPFNYQSFQVIYSYTMSV